MGKGFGVGGARGLGGRTSLHSLHFNVLCDLYNYNVCLHSAWKEKENYISLIVASKASTLRSSVH